MTPSVLYSSGDAYYDFQYHNFNPDDSYFDYLNHTEYVPRQPHCPTALSFSNDQYFYQPPRTMAELSPQEMEDFQRLSDNYRAELPGPLIGGKLPTSALATEYAQADQTYIVKTAALVQHYPSYRPVKGDGQCGWRGTVFGYFETLLELGDLDIVQQERVRLESFDQTMRMAGIDYEMLSEMFDCTWQLFDDLQRAVQQNNKNDSVILNHLDGNETSDSIVYHFKMMTSAYMQLRAEEYEPFLEIPIADYRASRIDPSNQEIDQIGLQALTDAVIAPANFGLEVLYLDRSMGEEVTPHPFVTDAANKPTIRLLYRPGHYDIIYKGMITYQVFLQRESLSQEVQVSDTHNIPPDLQALLFSSPDDMQASLQHSHIYNSGPNSNPMDRNHYLYSSQSQSSCPIPPSQFEVPMINPLPLLDTDFSTNYPMGYASSSASDASPIAHPATPLLPTHNSPLLPSPKANEPQIRLNANCFNYRLRHESVPLCTQTFGSAATLSTAHFRNQDFQPHIWIAEEEYLKSS